MNLNLLQTRLSLKTRLSLYLALIWTKYKIKIFFQKIKSTSLLVQHIKGHPDSSTYVREKGCLTFDTIRETPCSCTRGTLVSDVDFWGITRMCNQEIMTYVHVMYIQFNRHSIASGLKENFPLVLKF